MKTKKEYLSDFLKGKFLDLVTSKEAIGFVVDACVRVALTKKLVSGNELRKMFNDSIDKHVDERLQPQAPITLMPQKKLGLDYNKFNAMTPEVMTDFQYYVELFKNAKAAANK